MCSQETSPVLFTTIVGAFLLSSPGCGGDGRQSIRAPRPTASRRIVRTEDLTGNAFRLRYVRVIDANYGGKEMDATVAPGTHAARKAQALLTWLVSVENVPERDRSVEDEMGKAQRRVTLVHHVNDGMAYKIIAFGPRDAFGPTGYPVEIQVYDPECHWARTLISDREVERRLDDLFDEAFREKVTSSQESAPKLGESVRTGEPGK